MTENNGSKIILPRWVGQAIGYLLLTASTGLTGYVVNRVNALDDRIALLSERIVRLESDKININFLLDHLLPHHDNNLP